MMPVQPVPIVGTDPNLTGGSIWYGLYASKFNKWPTKKSSYYY